MTSARTRRIDEIGEESRRRIMDAAEALFAEKGFDRTSFVDIAERSGISRGSIPWHFQNKDGLLIAVVERAIDRYIPQDSLTTFDAAGLRDVFDRVKTWIQHPTAAMVYMVLTEALSTDGPLHDHYVEFFRDRRRGIALLLAATSGSGQMTEARLDALEPATTVLHGALVGIGLQYQLDPTLDLDATFDTLMAMVEALTARPAEDATSRRSRTSAVRRRR